MKDSRKAKGALALLGVMAAMGGLPGPDRIREPKPSNKMPLTDEEETMLASLVGKDKKRYVKSLKGKYGK